MKFTFNVDHIDILKSYEDVIKQAISETNLKGFRKGKAPRDKVIAAIGESKLQQKAIERSLPQAYLKAIDEKKLQPVSFPELSLKKGTWGESYEFEAEIAQAPELKLGNYQELIKGELAKSKIWVPGKDETSKDEQSSREEKIDKILKVLLENVKVEVPQLLIDREVSRMLSNLLNQVEKLGLKVDDYLKSTGQTLETLKAQYQAQAQQTLALEFLLTEIAKDLKLEASKEEVDEFINQLGDEKLKAQLDNPQEKASIYVMLTKQKVIGKLLQLAD